MIRVSPDVVPIQDVKLPDLFNGDGREDPDRKIYDLLAVSRGHTLAPARWGRGRYIDHVFFKTVVDGSHQESFRFVPCHIKIWVSPYIKDPHRRVGKHESTVLAPADARAVHDLTSGGALE